LNPGDLFTTPGELRRKSDQGRPPTIWMVASYSNDQKNRARTVPTVSLRRGSIGTHKDKSTNVRRVFGHFTITGIEGLTPAPEDSDLQASSEERMEEEVGEEKSV
jgi:hypothetical protein